MKISSSFWRFPGSEWESATLSPNFHFFFICNFIFFHFPLFLMVFHCFSWLSWISGATGKENEKKKITNMKKNENFLEFLKISWFGVRICNFESKFSFFFHLQLHFFFIFLCFWWFSIVFHWAFLDFRCHGQGKWKKNEKNMIKKKKNENFLEFLKISWFGVRICNFESKFSFFFHLQLHFFFIFLCFWWFSIVFHCFSWLSWISGATGKENEKKMKKKWKFPRVFEDFLVRSENLQLWVQIFIFFSFATSFFFHFPLFLMVFHCFSLFFMAFLDFRCHGQGKWKKHDKTMIKKWKKNEKFPRVFEDFLVRSENLQLWVQIFIFFHLQLHFFFHFPLFSMVFHCFSLFSWISGATGKENEKIW